MNVLNLVVFLIITVIFAIPFILEMVAYHQKYDELSKKEKLIPKDFFMIHMVITCFLLLGIFFCIASPEYKDFISIFISLLFLCAYMAIIYNFLVHKNNTWIIKPLVVYSLLGLLYLKVIFWKEKDIAGELVDEIGKGIEMLKKHKIAMIDKELKQLETNFREMDENTSFEDLQALYNETTKFNQILSEITDNMNNINEIVNLYPILKSGPNDSNAMAIDSNISQNILNRFQEQLMDPLTNINEINDDIRNFFDENLNRLQYISAYEDAGIIPDENDKYKNWSLEKLRNNFENDIKRHQENNERLSVRARNSVNNMMSDTTQKIGNFLNSAAETLKYVGRKI